MEQRYLQLFFLPALLTLILYLPKPVMAQCLCSDGTPALTQMHTYNNLDFPSNSATMFSLPKFSPGTGTLVCVNARIYLTSTVRFRLENEDDVAFNYPIDYSRFDTLTGPGISPAITGSRTKDYGPFPLEATDGVPGSGPDFVSYGPDTVYNKVLYEGSTSNVVGYLGTGTVDFLYKSTVRMSSSTGDYFTLTVKPQNSLQFQMTYSYCANSVLSSNIKNFVATLKGQNDVSLSWTTQNESKNNIYEIELSENGSQFRSIGTARSQPANGASAKYDYQHHLDQPYYGKLYFRIKQSGGKSPLYSEVKIVHFGTGMFEGVNVYPNPVVRNINLEFDAPVSGDFGVQLTNQMGTTVYTNKVKMNNGTTMQLLISNPPPPGIYYLRAKDMTTNKSFASKLIFTR